MLYHKFKLNDQTELKVELYEDEIVTYCGGCNKEIEVGLDEIVQIYKEGADFSGTTYFCNSCANEKEGADSDY